MSIDVSAEIEAEIITRAREAGLSVGSYLEQLIRENREVEAILQGISSVPDSLSPEQAQAKINRGLQQLERGEIIDGEQFMTELLSGIDDLERKRQAG